MRRYFHEVICSFVVLIGNFHVSFEETGFALAKTTRSLSFFPPVFLHYALDSRFMLNASFDLSTNINL